MHNGLWKPVHSPTLRHKHSRQCWQKCAEGLRVTLVAADERPVHIMPFCAPASLPATLSPSSWPPQWRAFGLIVVSWVPQCATVSVACPAFILKTGKETQPATKRSAGRRKMWNSSLIAKKKKMWNSRLLHNESDRRQTAAAHCRHPHVAFSPHNPGTGLASARENWML